MNYPINTEERFADMHGENDREISLGTSTILGIFFALALVCSVFFGFGYTLGRRSAQPVASTADSTTMTTSGGAKPAPGSPAIHPETTSGPSRTPPTEAASESQETDGADQAAAPVLKVRASAASVAVPPSETPLDSRPSAKRPAPATAAVLPVPAPSPSAGPAIPTIVQVTALTRQDDADNLVAALKRRGYDVFIRHEPQDKLLHVQIGPLSTKKDAESVRERLLADGYHAILKDPLASSPAATQRQ